MAVKEMDVGKERLTRRENEGEGRASDKLKNHSTK